MFLESYNIVKHQFDKGKWLKCYFIPFPLARSIWLLVLYLAFWGPDYPCCFCMDYYLWFCKKERDCKIQRLCNYDFDFHYPDNFDDNRKNCPILCIWWINSNWSVSFNVRILINCTQILQGVRTFLWVYANCIKIGFFEKIKIIVISIFLLKVQCLKCNFFEFCT